jgi:hypothetical protein
MKSIPTSNSDWDSVTVLHKSRPTSKELNSKSAINKALASGNAEIVRKGLIIFFFCFDFNMNSGSGGSNKQGGLDVNFHKIAESEDLKGTLR